MFWGLFYGDVGTAAATRKPRGFGGATPLSSNCRSLEGRTRLASAERKRTGAARNVGPIDQASNSMTTTTSSTVIPIVTDATATAAAG